jgi:hypothetical protein
MVLVKKPLEPVAQVQAAAHNPSPLAGEGGSHEVAEGRAERRPNSIGASVESRNSQPSVLSPPLFAPLRDTAPLPQGERGIS